MSGTRSSSSGRSSSGISGRAKSKRRIKSTRLLFILRFIVFFAAAFVLWKVTTPAQNKLLTFFSEGVVRIFDHHEFTRSMRASGNDILVSFQPSQDNQPLVINSVKITYNISFLIALLMAVPGIAWKQRCKILVIGIVILFFIQIVRVNIIVFYLMKVAYCIM